MVSETLGDRIRHRRHARGWATAQLADVIARAATDDPAVTPLTSEELEQIERGTRKVRSHELFDLAVVLGCTTGALLGVTAEHVVAPIAQGDASANVDVSDLL